MHLKEFTLLLKSEIKYKIILALILTPVIYSLYLLLQHYTIFPVKILHISYIEKMIPFMPGSVYLYESIWFFFPIAPWLMKSKKELNQYLLGISIISLTCFLIFFFFPTSITRPADSQKLNYLYFLLIKIDKESNAFPSLHVAFTVFHSIICNKIFNYVSVRCFIWLWGIGIITSTLLTKQHYFIDVIGGTIVGLIGYLIIKR